MLHIYIISFYYLVVPHNFDKISLPNYTKLENDKGKIKNHNFEWLDIPLLKNFDFKPEFLKEKLIQRNYNFEHIIIK